jgi:hypothetical protein
MKIHSADQSADITPHKKTVKNTPSKAGPTFGEVLNGAVGPKAAAVSTPPRAQAIQRPPMVSHRPQTSLESSAAQVEASLDALEAYRSALADPGMNLREVAALVSSLTAASQSMDEQLADLPANHPLREIGDQARATIHAEQIRFRSGIYG